jgi:hypothetical protein
VTTLYPCPTCGDRTTVAETRLDRRRRVCRHGHSFHTIERPEKQRRDGAPGAQDDEQDVIDWDNELGA